MRVGLALGLSSVTAGMLTDGPPPGGAENVYVMDATLPNGEPNPSYGNLRTDTPWVADADSWERNPEGEEGDETEFQPNPNQECPADGSVSGPDQVWFSDQGFPYNPTRYCARVSEAGFVPTGALRLEAGYWVLPRLAVSGLFRFQFDAGQGTLSSVLLGARTEYLLTAPESRLSWSLFGGGTLGQIQPHASATAGPTGFESPYIISGIFGLHAGTAVGWWFTRHVGVQLAPEIDFLFPDTLWHLEITTSVKSRF